MRLKDSLVSSLQFCRARDTELAWVDGVLDMRVTLVDTGVLPEEGGGTATAAAAGTEEGVEDGELVAMETEAAGVGAMVIGVGGSSEAAQQRAMKSLFGEDEKEAGEESDVIPTLEPLSTNEVR